MREMEKRERTKIDIKTRKGRQKPKGTERLANRQGWLVIITVLVWMGIAMMILKIDPDNLKDLIIKESFLLPGLLFYLGFFLILTILTLSGRRAILWSSVMMIGIYLRLWGLGNMINLTLLLGVALSWELYQKQNKV